MKHFYLCLLVAIMFSGVDLMAQGTTMNDIEFWVGTGSNQAALVLQWDDGAEGDTLVWGYRWNGSATVQDMIEAVADADPRFFAMIGTGTGTVGGFGYDVNLEGLQGLTKNGGDTIYPNENGLFIMDGYDYDNWVSIDDSDYWQSGWMSGGFWFHAIKQEVSGGTTAWVMGSGVSTSLSDGDWNGFNFAVNYSSTTLSDIINPAPTGGLPPVVANPIADVSLSLTHEASTTIDIGNVFTDSDNNDLYIVKTISSNSDANFVEVLVDNNELVINYLIDGEGESEIVVEASSNGQTVTDTFMVKVEQIDYTQGMFVLNEGQFGTDKGSVNFIPNNGEIVYRAFRNENSGEMLGTTSEFSTVYGDKIYFVSKQEPRLVVADAHTLESMASIDDIGIYDGNQSDGRAFLPLNESLAYISTSNGIYTYSLNSNEVGEMIGNTVGETGNMVLANGYVFAVQEEKIIILQADTVYSTIEGGTYGGLTRSLDGMVWVGAGNKLIKINPYTLENEEIALPENAHTAFVWGAWHANTLTASATENVLYWGKAPASEWGSTNIVCKYVIGDETSLDTPFITLPEDWILYGASVRIHPETNQMYVVAKKDGWGDNSLKNQVMVYDTESAELQNVHTLMDDYWFPAMPMFTDVYEPITTLVSEIVVDMNAEDYVVSLMDYVNDIDNLNSNIVFTLNSPDSSPLTPTIINDTLIVDFHDNQTGETAIELSINSNGKVITHIINVTINAQEDLAPTVLNPIADVEVNKNATDYLIDLTNVFTDADNNDAEITKVVLFNSNPSLVTTNISANELTLSFTEEMVGTSEITIEATSNGKMVTDVFTVTVTSSDGVASITKEELTVYPNPSNGLFRIKMARGSELKVFDMLGQLIYLDENYTSELVVNISNQPAGQYVISVNTEKGIINKIIIKK